MNARTNSMNTRFADISYLECGIVCEAKQAVPESASSCAITRAGDRPASSLDCLRKPFRTCRLQTRTQLSCNRRPAREMSTSIQPPASQASYAASADSAPRVETTVAPPVPSRERLISLDVFRGITVAGMLLVNNPGTWSAIYPPLQHATWHGWTPTDLIFPFFLFIVGITTHLSLSARRERGDPDSVLVKQIIRRGVIIYILGFLMAWFPFYQYGTIEGLADPTWWDRFVIRLQNVRIMGVLARIGIVYIFAALLTLRTSLKQQVVILAALLYGYWFAMTLIPIPGKDIGALMLGAPGET